MCETFILSAPHVELKKKLLEMKVELMYEEAAVGSDWLRRFPLLLFYINMLLFCYYATEL